MRRGMANVIDYGWSFRIVRLVAHAQREQERQDYECFLDSKRILCTYEGCI